MSRSKALVLLAFIVVFLSPIYCSAAYAQLKPGADIVFVKRKDGKRLLAKVTRIIGSTFDVIGVDGKNWQENRKLSNVVKVEWLGDRKIKGRPLGVYRIQFVKGVETLAVTKYPTFQIQYDQGTKWNTSFGQARLVAPASQETVPKSREQKVTSADKEKSVKQLPRRMRRGVTWSRSSSSDLDATETKRRRGVTGSRQSGSRKRDAGTSVADAVEICYNSVLDGRMTKGDYDTFRFYFPGGDFVCYSLGKLDLVADLRDKDGKALARANDHENTKNFRFERSMKAGDYFVTIRVMRHQGQGPYYLILGNGRKQIQEDSVR